MSQTGLSHKDIEGAMERFGPDARVFPGMSVAERDGDVKGSVYIDETSPEYRRNFADPTHRANSSGVETPATVSAGAGGVPINVVETLPSPFDGTPIAAMLRTTITNRDIIPFWRIMLDLGGFGGAPRSKWIELAEAAADKRNQKPLGLPATTVTTTSNDVMALSQARDAPAQTATWEYLARRFGLVLVVFVGERMMVYGNPMRVDASPEDVRFLVSPNDGWGQAVVDDLSPPETLPPITVEKTFEKDLNSLAKTEGVTVADLRKTFDTAFALTSWSSKSMKKMEIMLALQAFTGRLTISERVA